MNPEKAAEKVLCVPRDIVLSDHFLGFRHASDNPERLVELCKAIEEHGSFVARGECETDESLQQIIPYVVVRSTSKVLWVNRGNKGGESRLHDMISIGHGGHINEEDSEVSYGNNEAIHSLPKGILLNGALRELHEEIDIDGPFNVTFGGEVNLETNEVDRVHYGVVLFCDLWADSIAAPDSFDNGHYSDWDWSNPRDLLSNSEVNLETWSQEVLKGVYESRSREYEGAEQGNPGSNDGDS